MVEKKGHHLPIPLKKFNLTARRRYGIHKKDLAHPGIYPEFNGDYIAMRNLDSVILKCNFCEKTDSLSMAADGNTVKNR